MTFDERVQAVAKKGFTERQARFLTTVMLHTGVCVPRQYARFCGIVYGEKTRKFFAKLVRLQYASMYDCRHNRARIYHVNQRALYAAIGEADSRLRKPVTLNHAIQRLMVLDAIVEDPDLVWLGTAEEKAAHLLALTRIEQADLPHVSVGEGEARTVRYFPDRLPIGIHLAGRGVVVYVVTDPWLDEFRVFLERHAALLRALPAWTLRIVVPPQFPDIAQRAKQVVWNQLLTPLRTETLDELRWYFEQARSHPTPSRSDDLDERFYEARDAFSAPRFKALYRVWKQDGEAALAGAGSRAISDAVTPAPAGSRPSNSVTATAISPPWLPSPDERPDLTKPRGGWRSAARAAWALWLKPSFRRDDRPSFALCEPWTNWSRTLSTRGLGCHTGLGPARAEVRIERLGRPHTPAALPLAGRDVYGFHHEGTGRKSARLGRERLALGEPALQSSKRDESHSRSRS